MFASSHENDLMNLRKLRLIEEAKKSFGSLSINEALLAYYAESQANGVEFELTIGSGKVTLLTHADVVTLLNKEEVNE